MSKFSFFGERDKFVPKDRQDFIKHFDSKIVLQPGTKHKQDEFIGITGWTPQDGPDRLIFNGKPVGHRAFWSCQWAVKGGLLAIDSIMPTEAMSIHQIISEAKDASFRDPQSAAILGLNDNLLHWLAGDAPDDQIVIENITKCLRKMRNIYPEYSGWWNLGDRVFGSGLNLDRGRPGWPQPVRENITPYVG
jgi:hypothetical protein